MKQIKLCILILLLFSTQSLCASTVRVNSTGAAKSTVNLCALRDKYGFLWVGTSTGLACFDGNGKPVNTANHLGILRSTSNLRVTGIFEFGDNLLFAAPNRLMLFDRKNNTTYRLPAKTRNDVEISSPVNNVCKNPNTGEIWIATSGQGLFIFNPSANTLTQNSRQGPFFTDIAYCDDGFIYAAAFPGDIHKYKPSGEYVSTLSIPDYNSNKAIINFAPDGYLIWMSSGPDIYCIDVKSGEIQRKATAPATISSIINDTSDKLVIGTSEGGVMDYDKETNLLEPIHETYTGFNSIGEKLNVKINQLKKDNGGGILVVRNSGEILELFSVDDNFRFIPIENKTGYDNFVRTLSPDNKSGGLWIGSDDGLNYYDAETGLLTSPHINGLDKESITSITVDGNKVWIGTSGNGLILFDHSSGETQHFQHDDTTPYSLLSNEINDVFITTRGVAYVFTKWGLCRYNPVRNEFNTLPEIGQQTEVISMAEYYDGSLWASTVSDGILLLRPDNTRFEGFRSKNLENITVNNLLMSKSGTLWAATQSDGLFLYDKDSNDFVPCRMPQLANRSILAICEDKDGALWILTDESIIKISKDGKVGSNYRHYIPSVGLEHPLAMLSNGDMALGGTNGFLILNPACLTLNKIPSVYPTNLVFPFEEAPETREQLGLNILLYTTGGITLPFDHNSFTIRLAATHPTDMPNVTYDYMMEGFDKDWNVGFTQPEVTYNNLSPGTYRFMVRPSGFDDADTKSLTLTISPPWYLSTWAYIFYAILLLLMAYLIWLLVRSRVRKHYARRLESLKTQRERESWESKMRFFVDLVHEIRTPLMLISLPMEQLVRKLKFISTNTDKLTDKDFVDTELNHGKRYLESMQTNMDYLLGVINEILDFRKVDGNAEQSLIIGRCDINVMLSEIIERFKVPMSAENKNIVIALPDEPVIADIDRIKVDRVLMNLIGNARKYCNSIAKVSLETDDDGIVIAISDDGPGIPKDEQSQIFDLYYQIKGDRLAASLGTGLGLAYARLIAQAHGGDITVGQSVCGGAMFTLRLPRRSAAVNAGTVEAYDIPDSGSAHRNDKNANGEIGVSNNEIDEPLTVLLVDDNVELLEMMSDGIGDKYHVITASDGVEALEKLKENDVDFIVSDVMMPRMDGMELLQKVKENINYSHIPFIILTAKTTRESREEGMEHGADIYIDKPFSIRALIYQIENMRRTRQYFYSRRRGSEPLAVIEAEEKEAIEENRLPALSKYDREFLEKMEQIMAENISDEMFTIDILAERLYMSRSSFYRKIKALKGMTPVDYMKNYRLDVAARQLREKIRVNEVAANVGFTSHSYFAKCFKEKYGVLPRDYVISQSHGSDDNQ